MHIGIVGCGTAGPAAATFLAHAGHQITILERAEHLHPIGAGLLIQPTGMAVLHELGLLDQALALGHPIHRLRGRTTSGRLIMDMAYADLDPGLFGLGMHRGALFTLLLSAAADSPNVCIRPGVEVTGITQSDSSATLTDRAGRTHGPFDLVIIANGARTLLREYVPVIRRARRYPYAAAWFVAQGSTADFAPHAHILSQVYRGTRSMIGFLPSGRATPDGPETISAFWSMPRDAWPALQAAGIDRWKNQALAMAPEAASLINQVTHINHLVFAAYHDVVARPWHHGRIILIGDAAHAMSPQLGQGANLALADAMELAACLTPDRPLTDALVDLHHRRRRHIRFYTMASRWMTPWFQSNLSPLGWIRDLCMHPTARIPWVRKQMVLSLAGVKDGLLSNRPLPLVGQHSEPAAMLPTNRHQTVAPPPSAGQSSKPAL